MRISLGIALMTAAGFGAAATIVGVATAIFAIVAVTVVWSLSIRHRRLPSVRLGRFSLSWDLCETSTTAVDEPPKVSRP